MAAVLGKPVQLMLTGDSPAPSDLVRREWIAYKRGEEPALRPESVWKSGLGGSA